MVGECGVGGGGVGVGCGDVGVGGGGVVGVACGSGCDVDGVVCTDTYVRITTTM